VNILKAEKIEGNSNQTYLLTIHQKVTHHFTSELMMDAQTTGKQSIN